MHKIKNVLAVLSVLAATSAFAQSSHVEITKNLNYKQPQTPAVVDNYLFSTYYATAKNAYNLRGFSISNAPMPVISMKLSPAGSSYAVLSGNAKKSHLEIYNPYIAGKKIYEFKKMEDATAVAYSTDSKQLYVARSTGSVEIYDSRNFSLLRNVVINSRADQMAVSENGYHIALASGSDVIIADIQQGSIRTKLHASSKVNSLCYSEDGSMLAVLSADGALNIYDTRYYDKSSTFLALGEAKSVSFHPEGRYLAVVTSSNNITFINLTDQDDRPSISDTDGGISHVNFLKDGKHQIYLSYNSKSAIKYRQLKGFSPNYTRLLRDELTAKMEEWSKIREGETMDEYRSRVNEETRLQQARLFEQEIATRMADDMVMAATVSLGGYNPSNNTLTINFDNMPPVYLNVPEQEVGDFMNPVNLEFRDAVYGLTKNDKFELIYANVYNKVTGKSYEFNNLDRQSLDFLSSDDSFVPIELVQQSSLEQVKLDEIRKNIVDGAQQQNLISDHTHIDVNTNVYSDVDASGNKITNYKVAFNYTVDGAFSAKEDFAAGKYRIEQSHAAESMLKIVKQAFATDFAQYIKPGKRVIIKVTGSADAIPISGTIAYDGVYGDYEEEPYYLNGDLGTVTVTKASGIKKNEQLAFVRAVAVANYISNNVSSLSQMTTDYRYYVELSDKTGGEYRRINVEFTFVDAF